MAITDLTGTKWQFNSAPLVNLSTQAANINYTISASGHTFTSSQPFQLTANPYFFVDSTRVSGFLAWSTGWKWSTDSFQTTTFVDNPIITINSGRDVRNSNVIRWMETNATLQSSPSTDTKPIFKRINGTWVKQDAFQRVSGAWVRISTKETGNFLTTSSDEILQDSNENNLEFTEV